MSLYGILCAALVLLFLVGPSALSPHGAVASRGRSPGDAWQVEASEPIETVVVTDGTWQVSDVGVLATEVPCVRSNWLSPAQVAPAQWIWTGSDVCGAALDSEAHTFAKTFSIPGTVQSALLEFAVDNYLAVSINGSRAPTACDAAVDIWSCFSDRNSVDVTGLVHSGENHISITASNITSAAGIIARLTVHSLNPIPDTTITAAPDNPSGSRSASFSFTGTDAASYECQLDASSFNACTSPHTYNGLANGAHTFRVRGVSSTGLVDPSPAEFGWQVEASEPIETVVVTDGTWQVSDLGMLAAEVPCVRFNWLSPAQVAPAQWIWTGSDVCGSALDHEAHTFAKTFSIPGTVESALLEFAVDNYIAVSVNGSRAPTACDAAVDIWSCFSDRNSVDVTGLVHSGENHISITASNITSAAGVIARLTVHSLNPIPDINSLSPTSAAKGGAEFTLTVDGAKFVPGATVLWNGSAAPVVSASPVQLAVTIPAAQIASPGVAYVTVFNPGPGGGTSAPRAFFTTDTGAAVAGSATTVSAGGTATAWTGGNGPGTTGSLSATASGGDGTLTVARYAANPAATLGFRSAEAYFDVYLAPAATFTDLQVLFCGLEGGMGILWYDGSAWQPASEQTYDHHVGCITVHIGSSTSPSLSQLSGTYFGVEDSWTTYLPLLRQPAD